MGRDRGPLAGDGWAVVEDLWASLPAAAAPKLPADGDGPPDDGSVLLVEVSGLPAAVCAARLEDARRDENLAVFGQLRWVAALIRAWEPTAHERELDRREGRSATGADSLAEASVVADVAAALGMAEGSAGRRVDAARALLVDGRLPQAACLARAGRLDWSRLNALVSRTGDLSVQDAQRVESMVLVPAVLGLTIGRFEKAVDRAVLAVDAEAAERRRKAARSGRRVAFYRDTAGGDASASVWVSGPAEALAAVWASLDAGARHLRAGGDSRTLDQLRHDLLVTGCVRGGVPVPQHVLDDAVTLTRCAPGPRPAAPKSEDVAEDTGEDAAEHAPEHALEHALEHAPEHAAEGGAEEAAERTPSGVDDPVPEWWSTRLPDVAAHITVTMTWETLVGLSQAPAELDGYGAIGADLARSLAVDGIFRCDLVDGVHGTVLGVGRTTFTAGYAPGRALREFTAVAAPECAVPWCHARGEFCDVDHRVPYAHGGPTCSCNTQPLCRRHHRLKSAGYLRSEASSDPDHPAGTVVWTTRAGRRVVALPHAPVPADAYATPAASPAPAERKETVQSRGTPIAPPF